MPSIGTVGDSFDNALAETVNGYYKAELIYGPARTGPWKTVEDVELATLGLGALAQHQRGCTATSTIVPPAEFEATFYDAQRSDQHPGRNPIARASIGTSAIHFLSSARKQSTLVDQGALHAVAAQPGAGDLSVVGEGNSNSSPFSVRYRAI